MIYQIAAVRANMSEAGSEEPTSAVEQQEMHLEGSFLHVAALVTCF